MANNIHQSGETQGRSNQVDIALMAQNIDFIKGEIQDLKSNTRDINVSMQSHYVTLESFDPIRRIVYGMVGLILVAVVGALVALVVRTK